MLPPDTLIPTLAGPRLISDLAEESGIVLVFTWDGTRVTVGEIEIGDQLTKLCSVLSLDDDSSVIVSADSSVVLRNGTVAPVLELTPNQSLMPLYTRRDADGYLVYREPGEWHKGGKTLRDSWRTRRVGRMVAEWKMQRRCEPGDQVSFKDGDRTNCHPDNLVIEKKPRSRPEIRAKFAEPLFEADRFINDNNHKVCQVTVDKARNMFSIRGLGAANLAVGGIFISVDTE